MVRMGQKVKRLKEYFGRLRALNSNAYQCFAVECLHDTAAVAAACGFLGLCHLPTWLRALLSIYFIVYIA